MRQTCFDPTGTIKTSHSNFQKLLFHKHFTWLARQGWEEAGDNCLVIIVTKYVDLCDLWVNSVD